MKMRLFFLTLTIVILLLTACQAASPLAGSTWILISLNGQPPLPNTRLTLDLEGKQLSGSDGCNSFGGEFRTSGKKFELTGPLVTTLMACEEPIMTQASAYLESISRIASYSLDNTTLTLYDENGKALLVFSRE